MHHFMIIRLALRTLTQNLGRTALTLSGIIIAIAAIIVVLSLGTGVQDFVFDEIESFGTDVVQIEIKVPATEQASSGNSGGIAQGIQITTLTLDDAEALTRLPHVTHYNAGLIGQSLVQFEKTNKRAFLLGSSSDAPIVDPNVKLAEGTFFSRAQEDGASRVAVLGSGVAESLFGQRSAVGKKIKIKGQSYRVIGTLEERGSTGFVSFDDFVYLPVTTLQKKILGIDYVSYITLKVDDEQFLDDVVLSATEELRDRHDIDDPSQDDFAVATVEDAREILDGVLATLRILLVAVASISLLVGGVGIMNVMLVAVAERLGEIGLRKALGARKGDIIRQFLTESLVIALFGGIIGIVIALLLILGGNAVLAQIGLDFTLSVSITAVLLAAGFSLAAGLVFGVYPAYKAAQTSPMEAIRR